MSVFPSAGVTRRFAALTLGLTFVIFASCPVCLPDVAIAADALDVRSISHRVGCAKSGEMTHLVVQKLIRS